MSILFILSYYYVSYILVMAFVGGLKKTKRKRDRDCLIRLQRQRLLYKAYLFLEVSLRTQIIKAGGCTSYIDQLKYTAKQSINAASRTELIQRSENSH